MIKETFRRIEYSDESKFLKTEDRVELREYSDDLVFLANYNGTFDAQFASGDNTPTITGAPVIGDFDSFGLTQHAALKGSLTYGYETFKSLGAEGQISFRLSPGFDNDFGEQTFVNEDPTAVLADDDYNFKLYLDDALVGDFTVSLLIGATKVDVYNALATEIAIHSNVVYAVDNRIQMLSLVIGQPIEIREPDAGLSLITLMGGVEDPTIPNAPSADIDFFNIIPSTGLNNAIILTHDINSHILIKMYDNNGVLKVDEDAGVWSNTSLSYQEFELSFNSGIGQFFIGGDLQHVFITGFSRANALTDLTVQGIDATDYHKIDEIIIRNLFGNNADYTPTTIQLTPYYSELPFVDVFFGDGFKESEVKDLMLTVSDTGTNFVVKIANTWYYYFSGAWRTSDGTYSQSTTADVFETNFASLFFNENYDLDIRIYFDSNGYNNVWVDEISIIIEEGSSSSASITGTVALTGTVDLSALNSVEIVTETGTAIVDVSSAAVDTSAVTLAEIKQAIDDANVPGLAAATDDGNGHLVLISSGTGASSFISIDHSPTDSALDLIWDDEGSMDTGEDDEVIDEDSDFSELYRFVRSKLGAPLVPVELTDEQIDDCIASAMYHHNKWRNFKESLQYHSLTGSPETGYEIPAWVGGEENITDIVFFPRYPINYYNGRDSLMRNIYVQQIFDNTGVIANATDYHISLIAQNDLDIILNSEIRYEFLNKRIFLYPSPPTSIHVGIRYKTSLILSEIVNSQSIRDFTLAEAKITLGTIRSTFGNQIPGGDGMLQLNGSELKAEGKQEKDDLKATWKTQTNVYEFIIG